MGFVQQHLYPRLPVFLQHAAISAYGYTWRQRRFGGVFREALRGFRNREYFNENQWIDYQTLNLRKLLLHAFDTVPFYHKKYTSAGLTRTKLSRFELDNLSELPYLTKEDLRRFGTSELCSSCRQKGQFFSSSGTTGTPVQIYYTPYFHQTLQAAMEARVRNWAGIHFELPRGMIGGRRIVPQAEAKPPFYRYNCAERQTYFSAYHISAENASDYLDGMKRFGARYMTGYAVSNYLLASFFKETGLRPPPMDAVITSSESLTRPMRETLSEVYGCKTFDSYSGVENCCLISETPEGNLLISPDVGITEILPDSDGENGELVATGLLNFDQPLIRYRTGDRIVRANHTDPQGRAMQTVKEISGRVEDVVLTADGRRMVRFHQIFTALSHVVEGQIIQWGLDEFEILLVVWPGFGPTEEEQLIKRLKSQVGSQAQIAIRRVDQIPRTANGKFKAVISHLQAGQN